MKLFFIFGLILIAILLSIVTISRVSSSSDVKFMMARMGKEVLRLEVADTSFSRLRGLSGRKVLSEGEGMLFVFPEDGLYGFWMKDMRFPIDIAWLDRRYRIVHLEKHVMPDSYPAVFSPGVHARFVVELPAGFFEKRELGLGTVLEILP